VTARFSACEVLVSTDDKVLGTHRPSTPGWRPIPSTTRMPCLGPPTCPSTGWPTRPRPRSWTARPWPRGLPASTRGVVGDDYIRITVFLAAVLFLVGIGSTFKLHTIRYALIGIGSLLLILSTVLILQQPGLPG
jgi:hypothetical protein